MTRELVLAEVTARLAELRAGYVPESVDAGCRRLALDRPRHEQHLVETAARGLAELRALCELTTHLHRVRVEPFG